MIMVSELRFPPIPPVPDASFGPYEELTRSTWRVDTGTHALRTVFDGALDRSSIGNADASYRIFPLPLALQ
jgi:hypothetical protein